MVVTSFLPELQDQTFKINPFKKKRLDQLQRARTTWRELQCFAIMVLQQQQKRRYSLQLLEKLLGKFLLCNYSNHVEKFVKIKKLVLSMHFLVQNLVVLCYLMKNIIFLVKQRSNTCLARAALTNQYIKRANRLNEQYFGLLSRLYP